MKTKTNLFTLLLMILAVVSTGLITYQLTKTQNSKLKAETNQVIQSEVKTDENSGLSEEEILKLRTDSNNTSTDL